MEDSSNKNEQLNLIRTNIEKFGYHVNIVFGGAEPRYAYTIGLFDQFNFELVFAGGLLYSRNQVMEIFEDIINVLKNHLTFSENTPLPRSFAIKEVHTSWSDKMLLGVFDYYKIVNIKAFQIIPDQENITIDIPDLSVSYNPHVEPAWRWLNEKWTYPVSERSTVVVDLDVLRFKTITEIVRTDEDEWEMYSETGFDAEKENKRIVPLGLIIAVDETILPALELPVEKGLWRTLDEMQWNKWE